MPSIIPRQTECLARATLFVIGLLSASVVQAVCPAMTPYYQGNEPDWPQLERQLVDLMSDCLDSSEFFALLGAAQLNGGSYSSAIESLERALLLNPQNGAAQIDYAQALFLRGDVFAALELNNRLLDREDLPQNIRDLLAARQQNWRGMTSQSQFQVDVLAGFDTNLNSAPDTEAITLTLSGENVLLALDSDYRQVSGPYASIKLRGNIRQLAPEYQQSWVMEARARVSEDSRSDQLQIEGRYSFLRPGRRRNWRLDAGISNLFFGGSPLYSALETSAFYVPRGSARCNPYLGVAAQHQLFHENSRLNALEGRASMGVTCPIGTTASNQELGIEMAVLANDALQTDRPGGDRFGWQATANWQMQLGSGNFVGQLNYTSLKDRNGYNPLLMGFANRWVERSYLLLQYRRRIFSDLIFLANAFHQLQRSNIELFITSETTFEMGFSAEL